MYKLYRLIKQNQNLQEKRHPMLEKSKTMKVFSYIMLAFFAGYLMVFGSIFGGLSSEHPTYNFINQGILIFLIIDFFSRFMMQETPAQELKQYKLLPIKEKSLIKIFLIRIGLKPYNLFFLFFFVPFGLFTILPSNYGLSGLIAYCLMIWILFVMNAYWYLFWRALINQKMLWILVPVAIDAALIYFGMYNDDWLTHFFKYMMHDAVCWSLLTYVEVLAFIVVLFFINLFCQYKFIYLEIAKVEKVLKVKSREMSFLNRFGIIGEYLKLEIKSIQRNKVVKKQFLTGIIATIFLSAFFAFTSAYDEQPFMKVFVCMYCFACSAVIGLTNVMCVEGNYIDGLMCRKESILSLLKAKYYFYLAQMIIPLLIIIMPIVEGKTTIIEALACMFFAAGVICPFLFQLAAYNNMTIHLNNVLTKSGQSSKAQMIFSLMALFVPMILMYLCTVLLGNVIGSMVILLIGVAGTLLSPMWLRKVYERFMKRRYDNMANFRATR